MIREGWHRRILVDLLVWVLAALGCLLWRWVSDKSEIVNYWSLFGILAVLWVCLGFCVQLYRSYKVVWLWQSLLSVVADAGLLIAACWWLLPQLPYNLPPRVAMWTRVLVAAIETIGIILEHYWKYATNMTVPFMKI